MTAPPSAATTATAGAGDVDQGATGGGGGPEDGNDDADGEEAGAAGGAPGGGGGGGKLVRIHVFGDAKGVEIAERMVMEAVENKEQKMKQRQKEYEKKVFTTRVQRDNSEE